MKNLLLHTGWSCYGRLGSPGFDNFRPYHYLAKHHIIVPKLVSRYCSCYCLQLPAANLQINISSKIGLICLSNAGSLKRIRQR